MIYGGKALTASVWVAGIWAWTSGDASFFAQLMRILLPLTVGGHFFITVIFIIWGRKLNLATPTNIVQVLFFGMFHVADVWLKRAETEAPKSPESIN